MHKLDYFENKEYISNSMLGWFKRSPAYFKACIEKDFEKKESLSLERGTLLHLYILEPHKFIIEDIEPVSGMMGQFIRKYVECQNGQISVAKAADEVELVNFDPRNDQHIALAQGTAYQASGFKLPLAKVLENLTKPENQVYLQFLKQANGKIAISRQDKYIIDRCYASVTNNPTARMLLFEDLPNCESFNEYELYVDGYLFEGFKAKAKLDRLIINKTEDYAIIVDLKTTAKPVYGDLVKVSNTGIPFADYYASGFLNSYLSYCYYRQQAYYAALVRSQFGVSRVESYIVPVETSGTFECAVYRQSRTFETIGLNEAHELIRSYMYCLKSGEWEKPREWQGNLGYKII